MVEPPDEPRPAPARVGPDHQVDVLVVGAGPAGLATAAELGRRGVGDVMVIDRSSAVGDSWRWRYDRLHLHTPRRQSSLPGLAIPRRFGRWVARDDVIRYLEGYARFHRLTPRFGVGLEHLRPHDGGWAATTTAGVVVARQVVVATGYSHTPHLPDWAGRDTFEGQLLHAATYRNPRPFLDDDVLVVGPGNTGAEIAADLAEHGVAPVRLSIRTPPQIIPRTVAGLATTALGVPLDATPAGLADPVVGRLQRATLGDLRRFGMPRPHRGMVRQFREDDVVPTIDVGLVAQLRAGRVEPVAAVERLSRDRVELADGSSLTPSVVIAATGYRTGLEPLVGHLGVLDDAGRPSITGVSTHPAAPGLRFVGLRNPLKGVLLQINLDSRRVARAIADALRPAASRPAPDQGAP